MRQPDPTPSDIVAVDFVFVPAGGVVPEAWRMAHPQSFSVPAQLLVRGDSPRPSAGSGGEEG